ncbi:hypothetical protein M422DRAFT_252183 [Sphaerobolus stellatus SS14]|uniref:3-carboxymuconate cyclase n=1 Tax=Sphaerobolus stellatus (strain SS14) TaxID=990650 RepID=A0A0C9VZN4_SPHS4|nr:hypothetical protein M422DRAFT_252183 [Sphaerobolus stellatus SS14]
MKAAITLSLFFLPFITQANPLVTGEPQQAAGAVYFLTNQAAGNFIVSSAIGNDGKVSVKGAIYAGGNGGRVRQHNGGDNTTDPLISASSINVNGNTLYAVNAASNTIAMFAIDPRDPTALRPVGNPVNTGGDFPTSISVSNKRNMVCVLNTGTRNGISCFKPSAAKGLVAIPNTTRSLHLNQTSPPTQVAGQTLGHVLFDESETKIMATVQAVDATGRGFLAVWDVNPSTAAIANDFRQLHVNGSSLPFGMAVLPGKNGVLVADPAFGYETYDLSGRGRGGMFPVPGEGTTCWVVVSEKTKNVYIVDPITALVTEVSVDNNLQSKIVTQHPVPSGSLIIDVALATISGNDYLYVLSPGHQAIEVLSLEGPGKATHIQEMPFAESARKLGAPTTSIQLQGMTVWTP